MNDADSIPLGDINTTGAYLCVTLLLLLPAALKTTARQRGGEGGCRAGVPRTGIFIKTN